MKIALGLAAVAAMAGTAFGAVVINDGAGPVVGATASLDFDTPFVSSGPYAGNTWAGFDFALTGDWTAGSDTITASSNGSGQSLASIRAAGTGSGPGELGVAGIGESINNSTVGAGLMITLASPATEFSWLFVDQINMGYNVELFDGAASLGTATTTYAGSFPRPESNVNAMGAQFDRVHITLNNAVGLAFDNFAYVAIPAPGTLALAAFGVLGLRRRR